MKHAGPAALAQLEPLLAEIRSLDRLVEKKTGVFYRKGKACLHFHEDPTGLYADIRTRGADFQRLCLDRSGCERLIAMVAELGA